jgi:hypothetical protein
MPRTSSAQFGPRRVEVTRPYALGPGWASVTVPAADRVAVGDLVLLDGGCFQLEPARVTARSVRQLTVTLTASPATY